MTSILETLSHPVQAVCKNLANYGTTNGPVVVWNRTHQKAADLAAESERFAAVADLTDAVSSTDIVCLCLIDDAAVAEVLETVTRETDVKGKLFVDFSTVHPDTAAAQADTLKSHGAEYLASPSKRCRDDCADARADTLKFSGVSRWPLRGS